MRSLIIAVSIVVLSANCFGGEGFFGFGGAKSSAVDGFNFGYQINDGKAVGLLQAFDDGKRVYFQFQELDLKDVPQVWSVDSAGNRHPVSVGATAPYIVSDSIERKFIFDFGKGKNTKEATVVRLSADIPPRPLLVKPTEAMRYEQNASQHDSSQQFDQTVRCLSDPLQALSAKVVNVPFGKGMADPTRKAQEDVKAIARKIYETGKEVVVRGRPSGPDDLELARSRADSIRSILIQGGVPAAKINIRTDSAPKPGQDVFFSEIIYAAPSSGFVLLDGC